MRLIILILTLATFTSVAQGKACFTKTYCSTGEAPKFILCGRGQDCSKAKDRGIQFKQDCTVSWWLGDAQEMRSYEVKGSEILIPSRTGGEEIVYNLSDDHKSVTLKSSPKWIYSESACILVSK